jgi:hypothetical protein
MATRRRPRSKFKRDAKQSPRPPLPPGAEPEMAAMYENYSPHSRLQINGIFPLSTDVIPINRCSCSDHLWSRQTPWDNYGPDCACLPGSLHGNIPCVDRGHFLRLPDQERRWVITGASEKEAKTKQTYFVLSRMRRKKNQGPSHDF